MNLGEENILKTLHLLTTLFNSKQQFSQGLSPQQKATVTVTRQLINDAGITVHQFCSVLRKLSAKGYTWHFVVYDEEKRKKLNEFLASDDRKKYLLTLKEKHTKETSDKLKSSLKQTINSNLREGEELTDEEIQDDEIRLSEAAETGFELFEQLEPHEIGIVILLPFRSVDRLIEKMEDGIKFDQVQDADIWYDAQKYRLHVGSFVFTTAHRGTPIKAHFILDALFNNSSEFVVDYSDVDTSDPVDSRKSDKAFADSLRTFIKHNGKLKDIFNVYSDRLEINSQYQDHIH